MLDGPKSRVAINWKERLENESINGANPHECEHCYYVSSYVLYGLEFVVKE